MNNQLKLLSHYDLLKINFQCSCKPYIQIKTYEDWNRSGYHIKKGMKSTKLHVYLTYEKKENHLEKEYRKEFYVYLFCKCQVYKKRKP